MAFADKYRQRLPPATSTSPAYRTSGTWEAIPPIPPKKKVHWGMLYRSCRNRQTETVFAQRAQEHRHKGPSSTWCSSVEANRQSPLQQEFKVIHIPIPTGDMRSISLKGAGTENQERHCSPNRGADEPRAHQQLHQRIPPDFRYSAGQEQLSRRYPLLVGQGRTGIVSALVLASLGGRRHHHGRLPPQQRLLQHPGGFPDTPTSFRHARKRPSPPLFSARGIS